MAIALDTSTGTTQVNASSQTFAHTCTGSNLVLFVGVQSVLDDITSVTYNSVSMTQIQKRQITAGRWGYLYGLIAPATGANNVVVTASGVSFIISQAASYTGVSQSSLPDNSTTNAASATTSITTTLTTVANNCWTFLVDINNGGDPGAGAGTTLRQTSGSGIGIFDSNGAITPAGSTSLIATTAGAANHATMMASFAPFVASGPANLKSYDGNVKANIKSISGNLIANVKSLSGNS